MANKTIHELSTLSTVTSNDQIVIYNVASSATGKSTLEDMLTNINMNISEAGLQDNNYALSSTTDSTRIYMNIRGTDANSEENNVNLTIPMSGTGTTAGWFHAKAAVIQKKTDGGDYLLAGAFPLADTTNGFILDENVMDSATIAAWEAIL